MTEAQIIHDMLVPDSRPQHCSNCASDFTKNFCMGARIEHERVWLCSPVCYHQLKVRWTHEIHKHIP